MGQIGYGFTTRILPCNGARPNVNTAGSGGFDAAAMVRPSHHDWKCPPSNRC